MHQAEAHFHLQRDISGLGKALHLGIRIRLRRIVGNVSGLSQALMDASEECRCHRLCRQIAGRSLVTHAILPGRPALKKPGPLPLPYIGVS